MNFHYSPWYFEMNFDTGCLQQRYWTLFRDGLHEFELISQNNPCKSNLLLTHEQWAQNRFKFYLEDENLKEEIENHELFFFFPW